MLRYIPPKLTNLLKLPNLPTPTKKIPERTTIRGFDYGGEVAPLSQEIS